MEDVLTELTLKTYSAIRAHFEYKLSRNELTLLYAKVGNNLEYDISDTLEFFELIDHGKRYSHITRSDVEFLRHRYGEEYAIERLTKLIKDLNTL